MLAPAKSRSIRAASTRRAAAWAMAAAAWTLAAVWTLAAALLPQQSRASDLNLAAVSCAQYENEVLTSSTPGYKADPIDTVMWLFGFSIAKSGERVMYGDSLRAFGFALDDECKSNPTASLLEAVTSVRSKRDNPMDLTRLDCATFATRHVSLRASDPQSANTLTMWMMGFAVGLSGSHILDPDALGTFDAALEARCSRHPKDSVFDALLAPNPAVPAARQGARQGAKRPAARPGNPPSD